MIRKFIYSLGIIMLVGALLTPRVEAGLILRLSDNGGATWTTIADGSGGDANGAPGAVTFVGAIGTWFINVSTGISKPNIGPAEMDLSSVNISAGAGSLIIELTDDNFTLFGGGTLNGAIGGTINGGAGSSILAEGFKHVTNTADPFDVSNSYAEIAIGPFVQPTSNVFPFAGFDSDSHGDITSPYSMTQRVTITHTGAGATSFDYNIENVVPVPAGIVLLGMGAPLLGAGYWMRRRRVAVA